MNKSAIEQALEMLRELPDSDQQAVLQFLKNLKNRANQSDERAPTPSNSHFEEITTPLKIIAPKNPIKRRRPKPEIKLDGPRMTSKLAEERAVGDPSRGMFDGVAFLRTLR
jgi:hypothetical protein